MLELQTCGGDSVAGTSRLQMKLVMKEASPFTIQVVCYEMYSLDNATVSKTIFINQTVTTLLLSNNFFVFHRTI